MRLIKWLYFSDITAEYIHSADATGGVWAIPPNLESVFPSPF